jgi:hypothetical protein
LRHALRWFHWDLEVGVVNDMTRARRIFAVTAGLALTGAMVGTITGAIVAAVIIGVITRSAPLDLELFVIGAMFGAPLGAVLFPTAGWLLMRHVPLGKALLGTSLGTLAGGIAGWFLPLGNDPLARTISLGVVGFAIAVMLLRRAASGSARAKSGAADA